MCLKKKTRKPTLSVPTPIKYEGDEIGVEIHSVAGFTDKEIKKFQVATELLVVVVNSLEFKLEVINANLVRTKGMTPLEVYELFMSGADKYNREPDNDLDISVTLYYKNNRTIGYTYPSTYRTWMNRKFFNSYGYGNIVGNCVHEYMHNCGFTHKRRRYSRMSVPYFYGDVAKKLCEQMLNGRELTPIKQSNS